MLLTPWIHSASQEILRILWNPKVHHHVNKISLLVSVLRKINPVHTPEATSFRRILILPYHLRLGCLPSGLFPSECPTNIICSCLICPMHAICPAQLTFQLISLKISGKEWKL
jgi:hypothetical protein